MKKFILPVINLVALVLSAVVFGLGASTAVNLNLSNTTGVGNWYQLVWTISEQPSVVALLGFFFFVFAAFIALVTMIPFKARKFCVCLAGALFIASGVLFLMTPAAVYGTSSLYTKSDSLIAMAVLVFVAGGLELIGTAIEFLPEKK